MVTRYRARIGLSNVTVLNWIQQFGNNIQEYVRENMPTEIREIEIVEIDEMWHLTVKKTEIMGLVMSDGQANS